MCGSAQDVQFDSSSPAGASFHVNAPTAEMQSGLIGHIDLIGPIDLIGLIGLIDLIGLIGLIDLIDLMDLIGLIDFIGLIGSPKLPRFVNE